MKLIRIISHIFRCFFANDCANRAASLAYTTLLSLVPVLMLSFWILSLFPGFKGVGETLQTFIVNNFVAHSAEVISKQLNYFLEQTRKLSWSNLIALGAIAVLMIYDMVSAFNTIWQVKVKRHFALSLGFYSLALLIAPILLGLIAVILSGVATTLLAADLAILEKGFISVMPYLAAFLLFTLLNWALPSVNVPLRYAALAGLITTALFEVIKYFFGLYMSYFPTYQLIYGALSTIPIFLLWIYTSWVIVLLGAVICQVLTQGVNPSAES
jgi:membrane protein